MSKYCRPPFYLKKLFLLNLTFFNFSSTGEIVLLILFMVCSSSISIGFSSGDSVSKSCLSSFGSMSLAYSRKFDAVILPLVSTYSSSSKSLSPILLLSSLDESSESESFSSSFYMLNYSSPIFSFYVLAKFSSSFCMYIFIFLALMLARRSAYSSSSASSLVSDSSSFSLFLP